MTTGPMTQQQMSKLKIAFHVLAIGWGMALPLAALAASASRSALSVVGYPFALAVYGVGSLICHQRPERSWILFGVQMPVCARCVGIYAGAAAIAIAWLWRANRARTGDASAGPAKAADYASLRQIDSALRVPASRRTGVADVVSGFSRTTFSPARRLLLLSIVPGAATLVYEWSTGQMPGHWVRALSGVPLGAAVAAIVGGPSPYGPLDRVR